MTARTNAELLQRRMMPAYLHQGHGVPVAVNLDAADLAAFRELLAVDGWTVEEGIERLVGAFTEAHRKVEARCQI